jgi:hypothetical protein
MADRTFLRLNDKWSLASDGVQWILQRRNLRADGRESWTGKWFVRSTRENLLRGLSWHGVSPTPEAQAVLDALPETFDAWLAGRKARRSEASSRDGNVMPVAISPSALLPSVAPAENISAEAA